MRKAQEKYVLSFLIVGTARQKMKHGGQAGFVRNCPVNDFCEPMTIAESLKVVCEGNPYLAHEMKNCRQSFLCRQFVVGTAGFEPATPCTPSKCATGLRHVPILLDDHQYTEGSSLSQSSCFANKVSRSEIFQ